MRENERLKNEKNMLRNRGYNKNVESRYVSHIGGGGLRSKLGDYKTSMMRALGGDSSDDKNESSDKSTKLSTKNSDGKDDSKK